MKLLLPTDGKAPAENARELLMALGHRERVEITVLSVNGFSMALEQGARLEHHYSPEAGRLYILDVIDLAIEDSDPIASVYANMRCPEAPRRANHYRTEQGQDGSRAR